jgi:hypothetical protein
LPRAPSAAADVVPDVPLGDFRVRSARCHSWVRVNLCRAKAVGRSAMRHEDED